MTEQAIRIGGGKNEIASLQIGTKYRVLSMTEIGEPTFDFTAILTDIHNTGMGCEFHFENGLKFDLDPSRSRRQISLYPRSTAPSFDEAYNRLYEIFNDQLPKEGEARKTIESTKEMEKLEEVVGPQGIQKLRAEFQKKGFLLQYLPVSDVQAGSPDYFSIRRIDAAS